MAQGSTTPNPTGASSGSSTTSSNLPGAATAPTSSPPSTGSGGFGAPSSLPGGAPTGPSPSSGPGLGVPYSTKPATTLSRIPKLLKATYLTEGEHLLYESRPTRWLFLVGPTLVFVLVLLVDGFLCRDLSPSLLGFYPSVPALQGASGTTLGTLDLIVSIILIMGAIIFFGVRWIYYARTVYVVTTTRVIRQKGILARDFDEVQLIQVRGVDVKQHILNRILGYGTVRVSAEFGGAPNAMGNEDWFGVVRPMEFEQLVESAQQRLRGVATVTQDGGRH